MKRNYLAESWNYIVESRNFIFLVIGIFFISALIGFLFHNSFNFLLETLRNLTDQTQGMNALQLIVFIFLNNLRASLFGLVGGLLLGIFPIINSVSNGLILGFVSQKVGVSAGYFELWRLLPHGIIELIAVFISLGMGVKWGMFVFDKKPGKYFVRNVRKGLIAFVLIVVPLLIIAAIIEGTLISVLG